MAPKKSNGFLKVFKDNFVQTTLRQQTIMGSLFLIIILIAVRSYYLQIEWYNSAHGVITSFNPRKQSVVSMSYVAISAIILHICLIIKKTFKQLK